MTAQSAVQTLLRDKLIEFQKMNSRYSLRAFSSRVGVHVGALSSIMNGKRNVSRDLAERMVTKLCLDPQERSEILGLFPEKKPAAAAQSPYGPAPEKRYLQLSASQFKIVAEWEHFAVMSLLNCEDFESSAQWISRRLGITESRAKQVVDRLLELELFEIDPDGRLKRSGKSYRTRDDIADASLKKCHEQSLDLAKESLYRDPVKTRDFTSVTMAIDPNNLDVAKERIRKFQDELSDLLEAGHQTEVYRLSTQLFPLSKIDSGENK
jgi:uncharacterized protein (TIGR02147 family)